MSELKAYTPKELVMQGRHNEPIYLKSEADKAIAEKYKEIDELKDKVTDLLLRDRNMALNFNNAIDALVHNKYKRCLAMAKWCNSSMDYWYDRIEMEQCPKFKFYERWHKRWIKLAEKFKPNSTAKSGKGKQNGKTNIQLW